VSAPMDGYVRVSQVGGREGDSYGSPAVQESESRRWAGLHGVTLARVVREEDVSGGKAVHDRELGRLIERAERGQTGGVVVYSTSRFARSVVEGAIAIKRLRDVGARVVGVSDGVDSDRDQLGLNIHLAPLGR
jgi:DNA invertase Pin-like site-specific DNA recombinase